MSSFLFSPWMSQEASFFLQWILLFLPWEKYLRFKDFFFFNVIFIPRSTTAPNPRTLRNFTFKEVFLSSSHSHPHVIPHFPSSWLKSILFHRDTPSDTPLMQRYTEEIKENNISLAVLRTLVKADIQYLLIFYVYRYPWWQIAYYGLWLTENREQKLEKNPE